MKLWAIADPHLGFGVKKPMAVFGEKWVDHPQVMAAAWRNCVAPEDSVLLSGDISWAINFTEVRDDLAFLDALPGTKYIGRGNHDYWWPSLKKAEDFCAANGFSSLRFVRNNAYRIEGTPQMGTDEPMAEALPETTALSGEAAHPPAYVVCGNRGWAAPGSSDWRERDEKLYKRECERLKISLSEAERLRRPGDRLVVMLHYPPYGPHGASTPMCKLLEQSDTALCVFGHVHGYGGRALAERKWRGVLYLNTACDVLNFSPLDLTAWLSG